MASSFLICRETIKVERGSSGINKLCHLAEATLGMSFFQNQLAHYNNNKLDANVSTVVLRPISNLV